MLAGEQDLVDVLEKAPIGTVILDLKGQVLFWNHALLDILGGLQGDDFGMAAANAFFADYRNFERARQILAETGELKNYETPICRADEEETWAAVTMRPITFESQPATLVWYYDITQSRKREKALELSQETLLQVLDAAPLGAALSDGPGRVSYWNSALMDILGSDGGTSEQVRTSILLANQAIDSQGQGRPFELQIGESEAKWVTAWRNQVEFEGRPSVLIWLHDVTDLRRAEMEAEQATQAKSSFLATMSHEIRTPMNGVRTIAELMADTSLDPDQAKMVATIKDSADALLTVINSILDFSKLEAGRLEIDQQPFHLARMVDGVVTLLRPKAEEKGLRLALIAEAHLDTWRFGDQMRLRQILLNLIGNALKFTETGSVTLRLTEENSRIRFDVMDTGMGIDAEHLNQLFTPFQQAEASTARRFGGTGLGLSICKALVELMDGEIGVLSTPGRGSTFWFALPLPVTSPQVSAELVSHPAHRPMRWQTPDRALAVAHRAVVLCAEDNPTNRDVLARVLDRLGIVFEIVENGRQALEQLDRDRHGFLLTDGHMPGVDGWELTLRLRQEEKDKDLPRLPIVALTADAVRGVEERCRETGMDGYLTKPLNIQQVEAILIENLPVLAQLRQPLDVRAETLDAVFAVESDVLELSSLTELVGTDFATLDPMLTGFLDSAETLLTQVLAAQSGGDAQALTQSAHSMKGAALYVGARKLADAALIVEQAALAGNAEEGRRWVPALRPLLDEVAGAIEKLRVEEKLRQIRREIGELSVDSRGNGAGLDLETVVGITETAADRILAAAETILERIESVQSTVEIQTVKTAVMAIFEACSFQDLTSQRVRKVISRLSEIEDRLDAVVRGHADIGSVAGLGAPLATQDDIDRLFT
jgi:PAS domain S-box-containing protein